MKPYERKLAAILLNMASDEFAKHGCSDFALKEYLSLEECHELTKKYHEWNGDPEEYDPEHPLSIDWALMSFLASRIYPEEQEVV